MSDRNYLNEKGRYKLEMDANAISGLRDQHCRNVVDRRAYDASKPDEGAAEMINRLRRKGKQ